MMIMSELIAHALSFLVDYHLHLSMITTTVNQVTCRWISTYITVYYNNDHVWDGEGCSVDNSCCSEPSLPWFYRQIPGPLTVNEHVETRICCDQPSSNKDILIGELQLYVQW